MKKSSRRRRFFAVGEERTQILRPGEWQKRAETTSEEFDEATPEEASEEELRSEHEAQSAREIAGSAGPAQEGELPPAFALSRTPRPRSLKKPGVPAQRVVWMVLAGIVLGGVGGYFFPKPAAEVTVTAEKPQEKATSFTPEEQKVMDEAFTARQTHHFDEAVELFIKLGREHPDWRWTEIERCRTLLYGGKVVPARLGLVDAADKGIQPAEANYLLGAAYMVERAFYLAEPLFAKAVAIDPTRADYYYLWGDCLRADGKPLEAAAKYRSALIRNSFETADGLFRLKLWLSEIEAGEETKNGLAATLDASVTKAHPNMEVLCAAAAREIKRGDYKSASAYLIRARGIVDPVIYRIIISDPIFVQARAMGELVEAFQMEGDRPPSDAKPTLTPNTSTTASPSAKP